MLKEVNAGALAVCQEPEQIVDILDYTISGLSFFGGGGFPKKKKIPQTSQGAPEVCEDPEKIVHILEYTIIGLFFWDTKKENEFEQIVHILEYTCVFFFFSCSYLRLFFSEGFFLIC